MGLFFTSKENVKGDRLRDHRERTGQAGKGVPGGDLCRALHLPRPRRGAAVAMLTQKELVGVLEEGSQRRRLVLLLAVSEVATAEAHEVRPFAVFVATVAAPEVGTRRRGGDALFKR